MTALRTCVSVYLSIYGPTTYRKFKICGFTKFVRARVHFKFKFASEKYDGSSHELHLLYTRALHVCIISPKHGGMLNTGSNDFICSELNV